MKTIPLTVAIGFLAVLMTQGCAGMKETQHSLRELQGGWWSTCDAPAVEFLVAENTYSGDFSGKHTLSVRGAMLTFENGLVEGHGEYVSGNPLSFRIVRLSKSELVLRSVLTSDTTSDWQLYACP